MIHKLGVYIQAMVGTVLSSVQNNAHGSISFYAGNKAVCHSQVLLLFTVALLCVHQMLSTMKW